MCICVARPVDIGPVARTLELLVCLLQQVARWPAQSGRAAYSCSMMLRLLLLLLLAWPAAAQRYDARLGPPPAGLAWQPLPEAKAALLLPAGWHYRAEGTRTAPTYYLTQEVVGESGEFATGLSLQVVRKATARTRHPAAEYAGLLMLRTGFGPGRQRLADTTAVAGPWHRRAVCYREAAPDAEPRIIYQLALANARTDTLYLLTFESPEKDWPEAWALGAVMVREWVLDSRQ